MSNGCDPPRLNPSGREDTPPGRWLGTLWRGAPSGGGRLEGALDTGTGRVCLSPSPADAGAPAGSLGAPAVEPKTMGLSALDRSAGLRLNSTGDQKDLPRGHRSHP